jgi:hypothetical protein
MVDLFIEGYFYPEKSKEQEIILSSKDKLLKNKEK